MMALMRELYPICRSITGDGVRQTLRHLQAHIPLEIHEVPSGTPVFDWMVPDEWNIRDAYVANSHGERVIDFQKHTLHVLNYSVPIDAYMDLEALKPHLFSLPDKPDWIPYRTSYYSRNWGFCLAHNELLKLKDETYHVVIDSTIAPGSLTYGELVLPGESEDEVLISTHICHPSLCNDNLSGIVVATELAKSLQQQQQRYTYRFVFIPTTIGSLTWMSTHEDILPKIKHGLAITNLGDPRALTYKRTRAGNCEIDRAAELVLSEDGGEYNITDFVPYGYDERQFNTPGILLPVGGFWRAQYGTYAEYHTSGDNLDFVQADKLDEGLAMLRKIVNALEVNRRYINLKPKGEAHLGKRGLYQPISGNAHNSQLQMAMLWVLNFSDGNHDLIAISHLSKIPFAVILQAAQMLAKTDLLAAADAS
jgi:aminopeptidase-like protein